MARTAPALIIDTDPVRRRRLSVLVRSTTGVETAGHATLARAFPGFCEVGSRLLPDSTRLLICPWAERGESLLLERIVLGGTAPTLLLLSETITRTRIDLCQVAGNAQLVPCAPLDINALQNRIQLTLEGPARMAQSASRRSDDLRHMLRNRSRLAGRLALA